MAVGDVYLLRLVGSVGSAPGSLVIFTHHYRQTLQLIGEPMEALANAWVAEGAPELVDCVSNTYQVNQVQVRTLTDPPMGFDLDTVQAGTQAGDALPPQIAPIISWRTQFVGRSYRGRSYMPPCSETYNVGGVVQTTMRTLLADYADAILSLTDLPGGNTYELGIWSPTLNQFNAVTSYVVQPTFATQRRRRSGVGQ